MKNISIVFFSNRCAPFLGGVETHVDKITKELIATKHFSVTIVSSSPSKEEGEKYAKNVGYEFIQVKYGIKAQYKILQGLNPKIFVPSIRADVVHFHDWSTVVGFGFCVFLARKILRKKVFITFHGWEGVFPPQKKVIFIRKIIAKIVNGSINVGQYIEKWYSTSADITIIGGVDSTDDAKTSDTNKQAKNAFFVGRLDSDTGAREVVLAWKQIVKTNLDEDACLIILGDGPLRKELEKLVNDCDEVKERTIFRGFVEEPIKMIPNGAVVFTSGYLGILEAFARGGKVISFYGHELKKDYLESMNSCESLMWCAGSVQELVNNFCKAKSNCEKPANAIAFAKSLGWADVRDKYIKLWRLSDQIHGLI